MGKLYNLSLLFEFSKAHVSYKHSTNTFKILLRILLKRQILIRWWVKTVLSLHRNLNKKFLLSSRFFAIQNARKQSSKQTEKRFSQNKDYLEFTLSLIQWKTLENSMHL